MSMVFPPDRDEASPGRRREALWLALIPVLAALLRVWCLAGVVRVPDSLPRAPQCNAGLTLLYMTFVA